MKREARRGSYVRNTPAGRVMVVTRHPRTGREVEALGGTRVFRGKNVLDIGAGDGRLSFDIARYARSVLGVDPSEDSIRAAREKAKELGLRNVEFRVGDAAVLDVGAERFDVAVFSWSL
jgi:ubiquinone/menaquinone biosynthesis C-methylase UbiE